MVGRPLQGYKHDTTPKKAGMWATHPGDSYRKPSLSFKRQTSKMVKHTQSRLIVWVFDHFVGLALKGLNSFDLEKPQHSLLGP